MTVRLLTTGDIGSAMELSAQAGWNQTAEDWRRLIALEPQGCFGIEVDGVLAASATLLSFGRDLAWIGMVLTRREFQRRGFARQLMSAALDEAESRGVRCVKLDATDQGHALYASLGFVDEQPIERWRGTIPENPRPDAALHASIPWQLDSLAFGTDRSRFIMALGQPSAAVDNGYAMRRDGSRARYFGPCVARDAITAVELIRETLAPGDWFWDLLPGNANSKALAESLGFQPVRHLVRMRRGNPIPAQDEFVYAIAGFEAG